MNVVHRRLRAHQANARLRSSCWISSLVAHCLVKIPTVATSMRIRTLHLSKTSGWLPIASRYVVSSLSISLAGRSSVRHFLSSFSLISISRKADRQQGSMVLWVCSYGLPTQPKIERFHRGFPRLECHHVLQDCWVL